MAKPTTETFGARLTRIMRDRGLDNETLARLSGINASQISAFRGNLRHPRDHNQRKLAVALGLTRDQLTGDAELPQNDHGRQQAPSPPLGYQAPAGGLIDRAAISAAVHEATSAVLADLAYAILDALAARSAAPAGGQVTGTRISTPRRASGH